MNYAIAGLWVNGKTKANRIYLLRERKWVRKQLDVSEKEMEYTRKRKTKLANSVQLMSIQF